MISRRDFLGLSATGAALTLTGCASVPKTQLPDDTHIVVLGGGFGGATAAKYLRHFAPNIRITLIEKDARYTTCPFSNTVFAGMNRLQDLTFDYKTLQSKYNIRIINDLALSFDGERRRLQLQTGGELRFDRLIVSPGIDLVYDEIRGYDTTAAEKMPHAWKAGAQTLILKRQLQAMPDGGLVVIAPPANPYRCPPGPYERASLIAHYLKQHKPHSSVVILDSKEKFSKQALFQDAWDQYYGTMIQWVSAAEGGKVMEINADKGMVFTDQDSYRAHVANIIPPQQAGKIAQDNGLVDKTGWCPVNQRSFASTLQPNVHVIGDACQAGKMPKSGYAANSQAKVCAAAVVSELLEQEMPEPSWVNTCYSLVAPDYGISVAAIYRYQQEQIMPVPNSGGASPRLLNAGDQQRRLEAEYAQGWYRAITADMFG